MRKSTTTNLILFIVLLAITGSCKHEIPLPADGGNPGDSTQACDPSKVYFNQQVLPILISNCTQSGCHDAASHQEGVVLTSYDRVMATGGIRRGQPSQSKLYRVLTTSESDERMPRPPQPPLSVEQKALIYNWIQQGAQNLSCLASCDSASFTYSAAIRPLVSNQCTGCHSGPNSQGGIDLSTYASLKTQVDNGKLWGAINHLPGFVAMPKNGSKLSDCELTQVKRWIEAGAPNN